MKRNQKAVLPPLLSGATILRPIREPMEPTKEIPANAHGFIAISLAVTFDLNKPTEKAVTVASPPPNQVNVSLRYLASKGERPPSLVSLFKTKCVPSKVPPTANAAVTYLLLASAELVLLEPWSNV